MGLIKLLNLAVWIWFVFFSLQALRHLATIARAAERWLEREGDARRRGEPPV